MAFVVSAGLNGVHFYADENDPTTPVSAAAVVDQSDGGAKVLFSAGKWLHEHTEILDAITDPRGGVIPSLAQMGNIHAHNNLALLQTLPSPTAGQATGYMVAPIAAGTLGIIQAPSSPASPTNYRGGLDGDADLTGNSTGNTYLDGGVDMLAGDLFVATTTGTLTTNTGTNVAVSSGDHIYILTTTTDSTIVDSHLDVATPAAGVTSINFGGGAGVETGPVTVDLDGIGDGSTYVRATQAELDLIATNAAGIVTLGTSKFDQSVWDSFAGRTITSAGRNAVITTAEAAVITELNSPASPDDNYVWGQVSGVGQFVPSATMGPADPVLSVNGEDPDGAGNVVNDTSHVDPVSPRLYLTPTQSANIATALASAAANASVIARWQTSVALSISVGGTTPWDVANGVFGTLALSGDTTLAFPTNLNISGSPLQIKDRFLQIAVTQGALGSTLALTTGNGFYSSSGAPYVASTAPGAVDIISFIPAPGSITKLLFTWIPNFPIP